ncbi:MAG: hypothetical protein J0H26_11930 [Alphaproteobacteria bacterium]|nr:hypothetical protein [Alphaproteobacteria bacterium]
MKHAAFAFLLLLWPAAGFAATVSAADAAAHAGQSVTVEGYVSEVHTARSGKATFVDLDGRYPGQAFTAVVFSSDMAAVGDVGGLAGKTMGITGQVQMYRGRPEIIVHSRAQFHRW